MAGGKEVMLEYFKELNGYKRKFKFITYIITFAILGMPLYVASKIGEAANGAWDYVGTMIS